eukprot:3305360-Amphidinium_carterae.1
MLDHRQHVPSCHYQNVGPFQVVIPKMVDHWQPVPSCHSQNVGPSAARSRWGNVHDVQDVHRFWGTGI